MAKDDDNDAEMAELRRRINDRPMGRLSFEPEPRESELGKRLPRAALDYAEIGRVLDAVAKANGRVPTEYYVREDFSLLSPVEQYREQRRVREHRAKLAISISEAFTRRNILLDLADDGKAVRRAAALVRLQKAARALLELLTGDDLNLSADIARHMPAPSEGRPGVDATLNGIEDVGAAAGKELERRRRLGLDKKAVLNVEITPPDKWDNLDGPESQWDEGQRNDWINAWNDPKNRISRSQSDSLIIELAKSFRKHMSVERIRFTAPPGRGPGGPFVAFVQEVIKITNEWRAADGGPREKSREGDAIKKALKDRSTNRDKS